MSRLALFALAVSVSACSGCTKKTAASQEGAGGPPGGTEPAGAKIAVPGAPSLGGEGATAPTTTGPTTTAPGSTGATTAAAGASSRFRLLPEEGKLAIEVPAETKPNTETTARVIITASKEYKVNTEFPTKLTLESTSGIKIAKAELRAGGQSKSKGDADVFEEAQLVFAVKLTPAASGNYTINGMFKFAVCDRAGSTCLPKKEPIAIQVAAK